MSKNSREENIENTQLLHYLDSEDLEFDNEKLALLEKVLKSSAELETIGIIAKDLNHNIEVIYSIKKIRV
jgi:hypothetical protein